MTASRCRHVAKLLKLAQQSHQIGPAGPCSVDASVHIQRCVRRAQQLQSSDLRELAHSMADLRCKDEKSWQELGRVVTQKVQEIKAAELVQIAGSFSVASQGNPDMLEAIIPRIKESDCKLSCWPWADFILSLQRAKMKPDEQLVKAAADAWLTNFDAVKKLKMPYIMAFVEASLSVGQFHRGIFFAISELVAKNVQSLKPYHLPRVAVAFGKAGCNDDSFVQPLCQAIRKNLPFLPNDKISYAIHGLSLMDCKDKKLLAELATVWASRVPEEPIEAVLIFTALAKSGGLEMSLCDRIAACSLQLVTQFKARHIASILSACSQSGCSRVEFLEALGRAASHKISKFSVKDLCEVSFSGAKLSLAPTLGSYIPAAAVEQVSAFDGSQLAWMMYSVSRLSDKPGEHLPVLERAAFGHVSTLNSSDLRFIAMAWSKAHAGDLRLMDAVASRAVEVIDSLEPSTASNLAWAYSELRVTNVNLFRALGQRCADTVWSFQNPQLAYTALAFVQSNVHDEMALVNIAAEASGRLRKFGNIYPLCVSLLSRAFIEADLESATISDLLEELADHARQEGWTQLQPKHLDERTDFQKQCAEVMREFLPSIMVNQRHRAGPVLTVALEQSNGILLNLEVDAVDQELSNLDLVVRSRRDEFLEKIGVEVLRFKVKDLNDLRYDLRQIFGSPAELQEPANLQGPDLGALDESEVPILHQSLRREMELEGSQSQSFL